jgi:hypothetical protein
MDKQKSLELQLNLAQFCENNDVTIHEISALCEYLILKEDLRSFNNEEDSSGDFTMKDYIEYQQEDALEDAREFVVDEYSRLYSICETHLDMDEVVK